MRTAVPLGSGAGVKLFLMHKRRGGIAPRCARPDQIRPGCCVCVFTATSWNDFYTGFLPEHAVRTFTPQAFYAIFNKIQRFKKGNPKKPLSRGCVVLGDVNLPRTQPWIAASASQDRRNPKRLRYHTTMGERITSVELLAHKYAKQMVDRYRST